MLLLGFGNKARNGKDTAAEAIKNYYDNQAANRRKHVASYKGLNIGIFKYATGLYQETAKWLEQSQDFHLGTGQQYYVTDENNKVHPVPSWVQPDLNSKPSELAPYGKHPKLLQWWGTEFRRQHFGQDYWIKKVFASMPANLDIAMISDVRFVDEADAIKQRGGYTINVQRLREDGTQYYSDDRPADHPSEVQLDGYNWDFYLKIPHGHAALTEQFAINLAEYLRVLNR